jgi:hypothetical protein
MLYCYIYFELYLYIIYREILSLNTWLNERLIYAYSNQKTAVQQISNFFTCIYYINGTNGYARDRLQLFWRSRSVIRPRVLYL